MQWKRRESTETKALYSIRIISQMPLWFETAMAFKHETYTYKKNIKKVFKKVNNSFDRVFEIKRLLKFIVDKISGLMVTKI